MSDWREERPGEPREPREPQETGPLGDEETRRIPRPEVSDSRTEQRSGTEGEWPARRPRREPTGPLAWDEEPETREVRPRRNRTYSGNRGSRGSRGSGDTREWSYPPAQEPAEPVRDVSREELLRDLYGGVDWLASFIGSIFTVVAGAGLFFIGGLAVLAPLEFLPTLRAGNLDTSVYVGLAVVAAILFAGYFFGGYVSGRLARFDGGRNGLMAVLWTLVFAALVVVAGGVLSNFLPYDFLETLRVQVVQTNENLTSALDQLGTVGIVIGVGGAIVVALGAFIGGRLGERYHNDIERAAYDE